MNCSNAKFLYKGQKYFPDKSTDAFSTETLMASIPHTQKKILFSEYYLQNFSLLTTSRKEIQSFLLSLHCFRTVYLPEIAIWFLSVRFRQHSIERAMDLTDSFTWEDLPTKNADTGHLTAAGWIPLNMKYSRNAAIVMFCIHTVQTTIRIVTNHETIFIVWYPFDWTISPFYELVNISQVILPIKNSHLSLLILFSI